MTATESPATESPATESPDTELSDYAAATKRALAEDAAHLKAAEPPAPPPDPRTPEEKAEHLRSLAPAAFLYGAATTLVGPADDVPAFKAYMDAYLKEAGAPADPVERMLLEQLLLAHHVVGRLQIRANNRDGLEEAKAYHAAAARLMGEFRRTALALKAYRQAPAAKPSRAGAAGTPAAQGPPAGVNGHAANGHGHGGHGHAVRNAVAADGQAVHVHAGDGGKPMSDGELGSSNRLKEYFHERASQREPAPA